MLVAVHFVPSLILFRLFESQAVEMPKRIIRDWTDSDSFDGISANAERLFVRLIMKADDFGRFHSEPRRVISACFPLMLDTKKSDLEKWMVELEERCLIYRYRTANYQCLALNRFRQRLKQSVAKFPPPDGLDGNWLLDSDDFRELPGTSGNFPALRREEKGRDLEVEVEVEEKRVPSAETPASQAYSPSVDLFWNTYPATGRNRSTKKECVTAWKAQKCEPIYIEVMEGLKLWIESDGWKEDGGKFVPGAHRFLAKRKWESPPIPANGSHVKDATQRDLERYPLLK